MQKITLFQGPRFGKVANVSPFCVKVELFLRHHKIDYDIKTFDPRTAPRGKMPYILYNGTYLGDSEVIMSTLTRDLKLQTPGDDALTTNQRATGHLVRRTLEEATYFMVFANRWLNDTNWAWIRPRYFGMLPPVVRNIVPWMLRRQVKRTCYGQGASRYSREDWQRMLQADIEAIHEFMVGAPYFFGDQITHVDFTVYAFLANMLGVPLPEAIPHGYSDSEKFRNYVANIDKIYFSDLN